MTKVNTVEANAKILYRSLLDESASYYYDGDNYKILKLISNLDRFLHSKLKDNKSFESDEKYLEYLLSVLKEATSKYIYKILTLAELDKYDLNGWKDAINISKGHWHEYDLIELPDLYKDYNYINPDSAKSKDLKILEQPLYYWCGFQMIPIKKGWAIYL